MSRERWAEMGEMLEPSARRPPERALDRRLRRSITALERMVHAGVFDAQADTCGLEVEFHLVDPLGRPRHVNTALLAALQRADIQAELALFNLELNVRHRPVRGDVLRDLDQELSSTLGSLSHVAQDRGARLLAIGTLPTLRPDDLTRERLSLNPRYPILDAEMSAVRRRDVFLDIRGAERLRLRCDSVAVQAAATSLQVHLRVAEEQFARYFNAAQTVSPALVAATANSPYLLGHRLWDETRVPLIEQSLDVSGPGSRNRLEPPRVWMGDRWATSAVDVLADNVERYWPLLAVLEPADPLDELGRGEVPMLHELRLHNGSIWRWNRPVYDVQHGHPHLRIEHRVVPSGPTPADMTANAALFLGLVRTVAELDPPVSDRLEFTVVPRDLHSAARSGLDARLHWPDRRRSRVVPARRLLLDTLLPLAAAGLRAWGVDHADVDRYLGIVEERVATGRTGVRWQTETVERLESQGVDHRLALREMVRRYAENAATGEPVHRWPQ